MNDPHHANATDPAGSPRGDAANMSQLRDRLLELRVSELIERHPVALQLLIDAGFGPLAVPALRAALAHTVTLRQALRIRSLGAAQDEALLVALEELAACRS